MSLDEMKQVDIKIVPKSELKEISEVTYLKSDDSLAIVNNLNNQLINLYIHKRGRIAVYNEYTEGKTINEIFNILITSS